MEKLGKASATTTRDLGRRVELSGSQRGADAGVAAADGDEVHGIPFLKVGSKSSAFSGSRRSVSPRRCGSMMSAASALVMPGYRPLISPKASDTADDLGRDEARDRRRRDAGEGVGEHAPDGDGRVGEAGRAGEEVGRADVGADGGRGEVGRGRCGPGRRSPGSGRPWPRPRRASAARWPGAWSRWRSRPRRTSRWPRSPRAMHPSDLGGQVGARRPAS